MTEQSIAISVALATLLVVCGFAFLYVKKKRSVKEPLPDPIKIVDIESGLDALDEAATHFSGAIRSADAFRLVASRVADLVPFQTIVLYLLNESRTMLTAVNAEGRSENDQIGKTSSFEEGLAGQAFVSGRVEIDGYMMLDDEQEFGSAVAIPLLHGENAFGVIQLFFGKDQDTGSIEPSLFEAVGVRVSPLILGSISYERSQANALTDATTDLPNERAFYLVLENQVAEAQRKRDDRPLSILAIDIKNFDEINCTFGHVAGDKVLNFVAGKLKDNLRQMDFVARALNDEFLAILPTADKDIAHEIIDRIHNGFLGQKLAVNETQSVEIELNIGWAAFGGDGETPGQLLSLAQLRKEQIKSTGPSNVLWFPHSVQESAHQ